MNKILTYFGSRLQEKSTWLGIMMVITSLGLPVNPALQQAIIFLGMALAGASEDKIKGTFTRKQADPEPPLDEVIIHKPTIKAAANEDAKKNINDLLDSDK